MKIFPFLSVTASALLFAFPSSAQVKAKAPSGIEVNPNPGQLKIDPALDKAIGDFFSAVRKKQIDEAYDQLTKGSKIAEKAEDVVTLKKQTKKAVELFGEIQGYEMVEVHPVGTRLIRVTCMSLGADLPLRWRFYFYRSETDWKLVDLGVDDRLIDLFEEAPPAAPKSVPPQP